MRTASLTMSPLVLSVLWYVYPLGSFGYFLKLCGTFWFKNPDRAWEVVGWETMGGAGLQVVGNFNSPMTFFKDNF